MSKRTGWDAETFPETSERAGVNWMIVGSTTGARKWSVQRWRPDAASDRGGAWEIVSEHATKRAATAALDRAASVAADAARRLEAFLAGHLSAAP